MKGTMKKTAIFTDNLTKSFSRKEVIREFCLSVERGSIYGLLGKNGAGKTTLFKLLLGFLRPNAGIASVLGMDSLKDNCEILRHTGSLIGAPTFYEHLSAVENLRIHLAYMGLADIEIDPMLKRVGLPAPGPQPVREFSLGMRQRLAIARAVIHRPEVLILDEPVNGLDPGGMRQMRMLFCQLAREEGVTILLSSHLLSEVGQVADRIGVIADGRLALEMDTDKLREIHKDDMEDFLIEIMEGGERSDTSDYFRN